MTGNEGNNQGARGGQGQGVQGFVPARWPGEQGIKRAPPALEPFIFAVMQMVEQSRVHVEVGFKSAAARDGWTNITENFFDPASGMGRNFAFGNSNKRWVRFSKSILAAMVEFDSHYDRAIATDRIPTPLMNLAHSLLEERQNAQEVAQRARAARSAAVEQRRQQLENAEASLGLVPNGRGVDAPSLDFPIDREMQAGLNHLGRRTISPRPDEGLYIFL